MKVTTSKAYLYALGLLILIGLVFGPIRNPFGKDFGRAIVPGLLLFNSLQWLALSLNIKWRIIGALSSLLAGLLVLVAYNYVSLSDFLVILILGLYLHAAILWLMASERISKTIVLGQHIVISFVVLVGLSLRHTGVAYQLSDVSLSTGAFLFWSPILAFLLWVGGVALKKDKQAQVILICAIFQVGMGLFDLGALWNVAWGRPGGILLWVLALGLAAHLARTWQVRPQQ